MSRHDYGDLEPSMEDEIEQLKSNWYEAEEAAQEAQEIAIKLYESIRRWTSVRPGGLTEEEMMKVEAWIDEGQNKP